jgi:hypothetical protein
MSCLIRLISSARNKRSRQHPRQRALLLLQRRGARSAQPHQCLQRPDDTAFEYSNEPLYTTTKLCRVYAHSASAFFEE